MNVQSLLYPAWETPKGVDYGRMPIDIRLKSHYTTIFSGHVVGGTLCVQDTQRELHRAGHSCDAEAGREAQPSLPLRFRICCLQGEAHSLFSPGLCGEETLYMGTNCWVYFHEVWI